MSSDFNVMREEEVIVLAQKNDSEAIDFLMRKYKNLVRRKARSLYLMDGDHDDLMQEGMIGLFKAIRDYSTEQNASFSSFADLCISRQIYSAIKSSNRLKNQPLNTYVSIYASTDFQQEGNGGGELLLDSSLMSSGLNPEEILINRENSERVLDRIYQALSDMEQEVLTYYLDGLTYVEIAEKMQKEAKSIDNALQRIRGKVNRIVNQQTQV